MKRVLYIISIIVATGAYCFAKPPVFAAFEELRAYCGTTPYGDMDYIREWGFSRRIYAAVPFTNAVAAVSNHWQEAMADWDYFATNAEQRLLFRNIVGFSGTNAFFGVWDALMDIHTNAPAKCPLAYIDDFSVPPATPLEEYVFLNYSLPAVSNRLARFRAFYPSTDQEMQEYFDEIMSGFRKAEIEAVRAMEQQGGVQ